MLKVLRKSPARRDLEGQEINVDIYFYDSAKVILYFELRETLTMFNFLDNAVFYFEELNYIITGM